jgi:protoporphyrinogen oxidase
MKRHWGIVGGGLLGMTLALRLSQAGEDVTILEGAPGCGGLASPWELGDVVWDRHYHVTLLSDLALRGLLDELDLAGRMHWVTTRTGFYVNGTLHSFSDVLDFVRFPALNVAEKARLAATILYASRISDWRPLERITALEWLTKYSGATTVEKIWRPLMRAKLGPNADKASAAFIWAIIARMYAARRTGMKRELFGYVEGGYARILQTFEQRLRDMGVEIQTNCSVSAIRRGAGPTMEVDCAGATRTFDRVAVTLAAPLASRVCTCLKPDERAALAAIEYQGIICASLLLPHALANYYVTNITDTWVPFTAVIEMTALVDPAMLKGNALIYLPKYLASSDAAFATPDADIQEQFLSALMRMYRGFSPSDVRAFKLSRVRYVLPISTVGYSDRLPPVSTSLPELFTVNSAHIVNGTLNVNETVDLANRTARELLAS